MEFDYRESIDWRDVPCLSDNSFGGELQSRIASGFRVAAFFGLAEEHGNGAGLMALLCREEDGACSACYAALVFALRQLGGYRGKIKVGQGFAGKEPGGIGSGNCTSGCGAYVKGCPPTALDIMEFLKSLA